MYQVSYQERIKGIIVHGAKLLYALSEATVPRLPLSHEKHMVVLMM
jgi:acetyl-CoA carboxylase carboxyltransferase component